MIKYVIFDFDGTLVDSKEIFLNIFNQLAEKHGFKRLQRKDFEELRNLSITERCRRLNLPVYKLPFLVVESNNLYKQHLLKLNLFAGIKNLLKSLYDEGFELAVISSNSEQNIRSFFLNNHIDFVEQICCSNKLFGKDKVIKNFLRTHKLKKSEVIYVGDEQRDIVACKKCGIKIIWVEWGYDAKKLVEQEEPDYIVKSPEEILNIIQNL